MRKRYTFYYFFIYLLSAWRLFLVLPLHIPYALKMNSNQLNKSKKSPQQIIAIDRLCGFLVRPSVLTFHICILDFSQFSYLLHKKNATSSSIADWGIFIHLFVITIGRCKYHICTIYSFRLHVSSIDEIQKRLDDLKELCWRWSLHCILHLTNVDDIHLYYCIYVLVSIKCIKSFWMMPIYLLGTL